MHPNEAVEKPHSEHLFSFGWIFSNQTVVFILGFLFF